MTVTQIHTDDKSVSPPLPIYGHPDYASGYDVVIHDECAAGISDPEVIAGVLKPHRDGIPGVNLHCAMHSYRIGNPNDATTTLGTPHSLWFEYLGLQSSGHGAQEPISITYVDKSSPDHQRPRGLDDRKGKNFTITSRMVRYGAPHRHWRANRAHEKEGGRHALHQQG